MSDVPSVNQTDTTKHAGYLSEDPVPIHEENLYPLSGKAERLSTLADVDSEAICFFRDQGYLVVDRGLDIDTLNHAEDAIYDLIDGKVAGFRSIAVESDAREAFKTG